MKLIPLDTVLAEIEKRKKRNILSEGRYEEDIELYSLINSLEVKAFNLEEEIKRYFNEQPIMTRSKGVDYKLIPSAEKIAKHFFELGLNASNPLTWEDMKLIWTIGDDIPPMAEEDFFKELLKRFNLKSRFNKV